jgi:hypothetical protein
MKRLFAACLWFAAACFAQGPRVMIITDMEGAGGVNDAE